MIFMAPVSDALQVCAGMPQFQSIKSQTLYGDRSSTIQSLSRIRHILLQQIGTICLERVCDVIDDDWPSETGAAFPAITMSTFCNGLGFVTAIRKELRSSIEWSSMSAHQQCEEWVQL